MLDDSFSKVGENRNSKIKLLFITLIFVVFVTVVTLLIVFSVSISEDSKVLSLSESECPSRPPIEPYVYQKQSPQLLRNATLWINGTKLLNASILFENGIILAVGYGIEIPEGTNITDLNGAHVTSGLVDMHSHFGVHGWPDTWASVDNNEATNPTLPQLRSIDGFDPHDSAKELILSGGVTTSQILPGSANVMGGEAFQVKMRGSSTESMRIINGPTALKMACGENPKRVYGNKDQTPESRMGIGWEFRQMFSKARELMSEQDAWCKTSQKSKYPSDISLNPLVSILRKQAILNIHCYKVLDMEMAIRVSQEFGFRINSFHHALEAWKIPDLLRENNITVATFADFWGFKMEGYEATTKAPLILEEAGVSLALKSDHPVLYAKELIYEAQKAWHYGLSETAAIESVTRVPATAIGLGHRIGTLEEGKDADLVIWDRHPLALAAKPVKILIEGLPVYDNNIPLQTSKFSIQKPTSKLTTLNIDCKNLNDSTSFLVSYAVANAIIYADESNIFVNGVVLVNDGAVACVGEAGSCDIPNNVPLLNLQGGVLIPGIISSLPPLGLVEIPSETTARDGTPSGTLADLSEVSAIDGVFMGGKHAYAAWSSGITATITSPESYSLVRGLSASFYLLGSVVLDDQTVIKNQVALHVNFGVGAKNGGLSNSISGQLSLLRSALTNRITSSFEMVANGTIPLAVHTDKADHIAAILRLKNPIPLLRIIIIGGAEAHLVAEFIARSNASVILSGETTTRCTPAYFYNLRCIPDGARVLLNSGVKIGFAIQNQGTVRNLRFDAGWAVEDQQMPLAQGIGALTWNIADMFGLDNVGRIAVGSPANMVGYSGNPLSLESLIEFVAVRGTVFCRPPPL